MKFSTILLTLLLLSSCADETGSISNRPDQWLIPQEEVFDGGPGKDGIPALDFPEMVSIGSADLNYLKDDDLVIVYKEGEDVFAYSHPILDWHEIINTSSGDNHFAVTYCPLTGTTLGWNREINNTTTTFGVSGKLYNSNLIPYDRLTDTYYSQILAEGVNGSKIGFKPDYQPLMEITFATLKQWYPQALVTSSKTGHSRQYGNYPYGDYKTSSNVLFPVTNGDTRLFIKERVLGIVSEGGTIKAYQFDLFKNRGFIIDKIDDQDYLIMGDQSQNWMAIYKLSNLNTSSTFTLLDNNNSEILRDNLGNTWNAFGVATEGPNKGQQLDAPVSYIGYWFAWASFYPEIELFKN